MQELVYNVPMRSAMIVAVSLAVASCTSAPAPPPAPRSAAAAPAAQSVATQYGVTMETAVEVCRPQGEREYLRRLRCADGTAPTFNRTGSGPPRTRATTPEQEAQALEQMRKMFLDAPLAAGEPDYHIVDLYDVSCGTTVTRVFLDMYHCYEPLPSQAPPGFTIVPPQ